MQECGVDDGTQYLLEVVSGEGGKEVLVTDDLTLLGDLDLAIQHSPGLGEDGIKRGTTPTPDRATTAMEKPQADSRLGCGVAQSTLREMNFPLRRRDARVLVGVGVAQHDLLHIPLRSKETPIGAIGQECVEDDVGVAQLIDCLQQRHEAHHGRAAIGVDEPGFPSQDDGCQDIIGSLGHGDDARFHCPGPEAIDGFPGGDEGAVGGRCLLIQGGRRRCQRSPGAQLRAQHREAGRCIEGCEVHVVIDAADELSHGEAVLIGVFSDVQGCQGQADGRDHADGPIEDAECGDRSVT